jgi:hypothetical protein
MPIPVALVVPGVVAEEKFAISVSDGTAFGDQLALVNQALLDEPSQVTTAPWAVAPRQNVKQITTWRSETKLQFCWMSFKMRIFFVEFSTVGIGRKTPPGELAFKGRREFAAVGSDSFSRRES